MRRWVPTLVSVWLLGVAPLCALAGEIVESPGYAGRKVTIKYACWGGANEVAYARIILSEFVKRHTEIRVDISIYPWGQYWAKLQTQAASGLAPDVITTYSVNLGTWAALGALRPLDDLVKESGLPLDAYHGVTIETSQWDGHLYALPTEISMRTLIFSRDRLAEAGIPEERWPKAGEPMTWEQYRDLSGRLTYRNGDGTAVQYGMAVGISWDEAFLHLYGGACVDRDVNPTRSTVPGDSRLEQGLIELFKTQYGDRTDLGRIPLGSGSVGADGAALLTPKFAMTTAGPWCLVPLKQAGVNFGLAPMPRGPNPCNVIDVNGVAVYAQSKHVGEAWALVQFMASSTAQSLLGRGLKGIPALKSAGDALVHNDFGIEGLEAFIRNLDASRPNVMASSSYVPAALSKWLAGLEQTLDAEYDRRWNELRRPSGKVGSDDYREFVAGMDRFIEETVRAELLQLDAELGQAFARSEKKVPNTFVRWVMPAIMVVVLLALFVAYLRWIAGNRDSQHSRLKQSNLAGYLFISPWLIGTICFALGPIISAIFISFTEWNMISPPTWIGMQHYTSLWGDAVFFTGLKRTLLYAALAIPISLCGGLLTAGLLTCDVRGRDAIKAILYFPSLFTGAAVAVLWINMFNKEHGVINLLLSHFGINPVSWLDEGHAFYTVILMNVFWVGGAMVIYYAGMKQIPSSLYEAAAIDGAGPLRCFSHVTIPLLSPVSLFMVIMTTIGAFQVFTPALFFAQSSATIGEPGDALRFYSVNIYNEAFNNLNMGRASCYALVLFGIIFLLTMLQMKLSKRFVHSE